MNRPRIGWNEHATWGICILGAGITYVMWIICGFIRGLANCKPEELLQE